MQIPLDMSCKLVLQVISLTPLQIEQVLIWRDEHLRNMHAVYEQLQHINAEVRHQCLDSSNSRWG